jgi:hypothetical protein
MHEHDENTIVQNCYFYNPVAGWVYAKYGKSGGSVQTTYRYNLFDRVVNAPFTGTSLYFSQDVRVYQNVFIGSGSNGDIYFSRWAMDNQHFKIYNNTFYNVLSPLWSWASTSISAHQFFNNIIYSDIGRLYGVDFNEVNGSTNGAYIDYNDYFSNGAGDLDWRLNYKSYSTLSAWASATGHDQHSATNSPNFINASGNFNQPSDFKRTSYAANGRGNGYPSVMGAYVTGNEVIGLLGGSGANNPPPQAQVPSPQNLRTSN